MMQHTFGADPLYPAPATGSAFEKWKQASRYDTFTRFIGSMTSTHTSSREEISIFPDFAADRKFLNVFDRGTSSGFHLSCFINQPEGDWSGIQLVRELRQLSGLTWYQMADLLCVKPRTLHNWAAGHVIAEKNRRRLGELLAVLRHIDRGYAQANRNLMLNTSVAGRTLFLLLRDGEFDLVKEQAGRGPGRTGSPAALPLATLNTWGPEHFGMALLASLHDQDDEVVPVTSTGKRPANARRKG